MTTGSCRHRILARVVSKTRERDGQIAAAISPGTSSPQAAQSVREDESPAAIPKAVGSEPEG